MYEAVLKMAIKDPEFEFKTRNTPYPLRTYQKDVIHKGSIYYLTMDYFS